MLAADARQPFFRGRQERIGGYIDLKGSAMSRHSSSTVKPMLYSRQNSPRSGAMRTFTAAAMLLTATTCFAQSYGDPFLPTPARSVSTVPTTGTADVNPYGVAFVGDNFQAGRGPLMTGDILVSNFNNAQNLQGTGTSIVRVPAKGGAPSVFFRSSGTQTGLSTALGVLQKGFVVVGSLPTTDGTSATATAGALLVVNSQGQLVQSFTNKDIQGPWDMALVDANDFAFAFIANALTGTITRLDFRVNGNGLSLLNSTVIATGYMHRGDPAALFVAPTGLVYDVFTDRLFVASTEDNEVFAVQNAIRRTDDGGRGTLIYQDNVHLHGPLGMASAPNGHLLVSNSDVINSDPNQPSEIVEFTKDGRFVRELSVDPAQGGSFGLAVRSMRDGAVFAAVDDNASTLTIWTITE